MMFYFVVNHLRWLSRLPLFPQAFDGLLMAWTWVLYPQRIEAMEKLEASMLRRSGMATRIHRFGGIEFHHPVLGELGHVHGHGLLDLRVPRSEAERLLRQGIVKRHHILSGSGWISFQLHSASDVAFALELLQRAAERSNPPVPCNP